MRTDLRQRETTKVSSSLPIDLSCRTLPALHTHGPDQDLLLWFPRINQALHRDQLRVRLELW